MKINIGIAALSLLSLSPAFAADTLEAVVRPALGTPYAHGPTTDWNSFDGTYRVRVTLAPAAASSAVSARQELEATYPWNEPACTTTLSFTAGEMKIELLSQSGEPLHARTAPLTFSITQTEDGECGAIPASLTGGAIAIAESRDMGFQMTNGAYAKLTFFVPVSGQVSVAGGEAQVELSSVKANRLDWFAETLSDYPDALKTRGISELRDPTIPVVEEETDYHPYDHD